MFFRSAPQTGPLYFYNHHLGTWLCGILSLFSIWCATSEAAIGLGKNLAVSLLDVESVSDSAMTAAFLFFAYSLQYMMTAAIFEVTHPRGAWSNQLSEQEKKKRREQIWREIQLGVGAMFGNTFTAVFWISYVEPQLWTYGFFGHRSFNIWWLIASVPVYMLCFDTWFYWTHRLLHESEYLWKHVHTVHHGFKNPTAFCQDAVHPFEAVLQGPLGHYVSQLFFPFHPVAHALFGFATSVFAIAAHDGRAWDLNNHTYHHTKGTGRLHSFNYGLYWGLWDYMCDTRYSDRIVKKTK